MSTTTLCKHHHILLRLVSLLWFLLIATSNALTVVQASRIRKIELDITLGTMNPDCYNQTYPVLLVNGQHPAPPIRATKDDELQITVRNSVGSKYSTSIHYHGILQIGTNEADGMPNVTQASIPPGSVYHQNFRVVGQTGTYYYHSHTDYQDSSVHGPFIIYETDQDWPTLSEDEGVEVIAMTTNIIPSYRNNNPKLHEGPYEYDDERILFFTDWWHQTDQSRLDFALGPEFTVLSEADSCLVNGRTVYNPSKNLDNPNCEGYSAIDVEPGKVYRLRVIGATTMPAMGFTIARHSFTIIEVDGELVQPFQTKFLEVSPGQRFSVLLKTDQVPNESYNIAIEPYFTLFEESNDNNAQITSHIPKDNVNKPEIFEPHARRATIPDMPTLPDTTAPQKQGWIFPKLKSVKPITHDFRAPPDRTIILTPAEKQLEDNTTRWLINGRIPHDWNPYLLSILETMDHPTLNETAIQLNKEGLTDGFDEGHKTYPLRVGEVVDFVIHSTLQIVKPGQGFCASHPWHTHGMVHYPIADGYWQYDDARDKNLRTYPNPIARDTSISYAGPSKNEPAVGGAPCGWTKLRVFVSNPGVWGFHCHITGHMLQGLMTVLEVSTEQIPVLQHRQVVQENQ
ncbi:Cupredoxin [Phascolomyces articulosus]|uniref:Cupredoxin n=1 Tax=Phascolomyces articulosus TaxID=60185 RepID=A0AAD5JU36_9FUNG|nr:Cupredoxin [Phascolomyces articulosus]